MMYCVPIQNVAVQLIMFSNRFRAYGQCCVFYRFFGVEQGRAGRGAFSPPVILRWRKNGRTGPKQNKGEEEEKKKGEMGS